jgi:hypothetical protein
LDKQDDQTGKFSMNSSRWTGSPSDMAELTSVTMLRAQPLWIEDLVGLARDLIKVTH